MSIQQIRADLVAVLLGAEVVGEMSPYPPESIGTMPSGYLSDATATVSMGALEVWAYLLRLVILVARTGTYGKELAAVEEVSAVVMTVIRENYTLANTVYGLDVTKWSEGVIEVAGQQFVAVSFDLKIKQKFPVSLEG